MDKVSYALGLSIGQNFKASGFENINGEDLKDGLERFLKGLEKIREEQKSGNILIVTHGTVLELFFNHIQNREADDLDERKLIGNGQYKIFTFENEKYIAL